MLLLFYICFSMLILCSHPIYSQSSTGAFIIIMKPSRIAQFLYDKARILAAMQFGWLILIAALGAQFMIFHIPMSWSNQWPYLVGVSFPPAIGHTTIITLCGFAYGLKGFWIGAAGSVLGSSISFITLRLLFSKRLHAWSSQNQKWQALESVVVNRFFCDTHYSPKLY